MRNFDELVILAPEGSKVAPPVPGARRVWGLVNAEPGSRPVGWLMPPICNHVSEQPKSLAVKLLQGRIDTQRGEQA